MSFKEVVMAMQGYNNHFEQQEQTQWERLRWQTTLLLNVHTAKGKSKEVNDKSIFDKWDKE
jgi:ribulose bisphosphate carboxylase small subunit